MSLVSVRNNIVSTLKSELASLKSCDGHPGRFDLNELKRTSSDSPAVRVACLGFSGADGTGETNSKVAWAAYVITANTKDEPRDEKALAICNSIAILLRDQTWSDNSVNEVPENISAQNLYSASLDRNGVAMWAVTWRQGINLGDDTDLTDLDNFVSFTGTAGDENENTLIETAGELETDA